MIFLCLLDNTLLQRFVKAYLLAFENSLIAFFKASRDSYWHSGGNGIVEGIVGGIEGGIVGGIVRGIVGGIEGGIVGSIVRGIVGGIVGGIVEGVVEGSIEGIVDRGSTVSVVVN